MNIDLRNCKKGDKLRIRMTNHMRKCWSTRSDFEPEDVPDIVTYVGLLPDTDYYEHKIQYEDGGFGSRCDDGSCFRKNKTENDMDVIEVL